MGEKGSPWAAAFRMLLSEAMAYDWKVLMNCISNRGRRAHEYCIHCV